MPVVAFTILLSVLFVMALVVIGVVLKNLKICQPNEVLVISGRSRRRHNRRVGYRLIHGGRAFVFPVIERVDRLDLTNMALDVRVRGSYSKGGIPLNVDAVANLKISSTEPTIGNAIERFLGRSRAEIIQVARDTLEGNLRGVLAMLTPEEVNNDRVKFAQSLLHEADSDLKKLGLVLDTLKIQNVSDDKGYLDSIGRKQTAELLTRSRVAEAENKALSTERDAANFENKEVARIEAKIHLVRAETEKRIVDALTKKDAMIAEQRGQVEALIAKTEAELDVQRARIDQVRLQLTADRIRPAEASYNQMVQNAKASTAPIIEQGKATAASLRHVSEVWKAAGPDARRILVAQNLNELVSGLLNSVHETPIGKVTLIDEKLVEGKGQLGTQATLLSEIVGQTLGISLPEIAKAQGKGVTPPPVPELSPPAR